MKPCQLRISKLVLWAVVSAGVAFSTLADQALKGSRPEKTYTGTIASVHPHRVRVNGWMFSKDFNLGDSCTYALLGRRGGTAADLRPGQKVTVRYVDAEGVLVADRVEQQPVRVEGTVKAVDVRNGLLVVHVRGGDRTFQLPADCRVVLRDDKSGTTTDLQRGERVVVTYETPNGEPTAREIAQTSASFTGSLTAIDLTDRTVKAKSAFGSKEFHLGDGCVILLNGKADADLRDLRPGEKLTFNYEDVNGVNVVNRIASAAGAAEAMTAQSK